MTTPPGDALLARAEAWAAAAARAPAAALRCHSLEASSGAAAPPRRAAPPRPGSRFRGVTHHARTDRFESHIWASP
jgi:hypothetical protein